MTDDLARMTVGELREELSALDPDTLIVLSINGEFSPLNDLGSAVYVAATVESGHLLPEECDDESVGNESGESCIVLWAMR